MKPYLILIDSFIIGLAFFWQLHLLFKADRRKKGSAGFMLPEFLSWFVPDFIPRRCVIPLIFGLFIIIGTIAFILIDCSKHYCYGTSETVLVGFIISFLFALSLILKAWFGPLVLGISLAVGIHESFSGAGFYWLADLLQDIFEGFLPKAFYVIYSFVTLSYVFLSSIADTINDL